MAHSTNSFPQECFRKQQRKTEREGGIERTNEAWKPHSCLFVNLSIVLSYNASDFSVVEASLDLKSHICISCSLGQSSRPV